MDLELLESFKIIREGVVGGHGGGKSIAAELDMVPMKLNNLINPDQQARNKLGWVDLYRILRAGNDYAFTEWFNRSFGYSKPLTMTSLENSDQDPLASALEIFEQIAVMAPVIRAALARGWLTGEARSQLLEAIAKNEQACAQLKSTLGVDLSFTLSVQSMRPRTARAG